MGGDRGRILSSDRVAVVGSTGSGKSFLTSRYVTQYPYVIVVDPKHSRSVKQGFPRGRVVSTIEQVRKFPSEVRRGKGGHLIVRPKPQIVADRKLANAFYDELFWMIFEMRNVVTVVDELLAVCGVPPESINGLNALIQMGRERGCGGWMQSQRPRWVPGNTLSEADHYFCFRLGKPEDRAFMADLMETPEVRNVAPDPHGFWYYRPGLERAVYFSRLKVAS